MCVGSVVRYSSAHCTLVSPPGGWERDGRDARSRELAEAAGPGSGLVASTVLALSLAWANVEAPEAQAGFELPYKVGRGPPCCVGVLCFPFSRAHERRSFW